jgi:hypothetical protein
VHPRAVRSKAAAILREADSSSLADFEKGVALTGGERVDWWTGNGAEVLPVRLAKTNITAFNEADKFFTADNEPASARAWLDAFGVIPGDVQNWFNSDVGQGYDPALQAKVEADFAAAEQQVANMAAGQ